MKILITGASGFLGFRTIEFLVQQPDVEHIIGCDRITRETHYVDNPKVEYVLGDITKVDFIDEQVSKVDHVIHCAAVTSDWGPWRLFEKVNVTATGTLIRVSEKHGIKRFVFMSSPQILFEMRSKYNMKEDDPLPKTFITNYARSKWEAEQLLKASKLDYVILRPRGIIGRGDTVIMPRLLKLHEQNKLFIIGSGKNMVDFASVGNVVHAINLGLHAKKEALRNTYNITNGKPENLWKALETILNKLGKEMPKKRIPFWLIAGITYTLEFIAVFTRKKPALTHFGVLALAKSNTLDITKARTLLGYEPIQTTEDSMDEFIEDYYSNESHQKIEPSS